MTAHAKSLLSDASQEELATCIRLLALSVAHHRHTSAFTSLRDSAELLKPQNTSKEKAALFMQSRDLVAEALELVRVLAAEAPPKKAANTDEENEERRKQLRISVSAPVKIIWSGNAQPSTARTQNISWGGASIVVDKAQTHSGDTIQLLLPGITTPYIRLEAKVLRTWPLSSVQGEGMALRFSSIATKDQDAFESLLKKLAQSGDNEGLRQHARLTQHLDIQFDGPDDLHATLDDISAGGMGVTVPDPIQIGQSLETMISTMDGGFNLKLRARVVRVEPVKMGSVVLYQAGLKFEHPSKELNSLTRELIAQLAGNSR